MENNYSDIDFDSIESFIFSDSEHAINENAGSEFNSSVNEKIEEKEPKLIETIDPTIIITVADIVLSRSLAFIFKLIDSSIYNPSDLQLTATETNKIKPIVGRLIEKYSVKLKDEVALLVLLVAIYGSKIVTTQAKKEAKNKEKESGSEVEKWPNYKTHLKNGKLRKAPLE